MMDLSLQCFLLQGGTPNYPEGVQYNEFGVVTNAESIRFTKDRLLIEFYVACIGGFWGGAVHAFMLPSQGFGSPLVQSDFTHYSRHSCIGGLWDEVFGYVRRSCGVDVYNKVFKIYQTWERNAEH